MIISVFIDALTEYLLYYQMYICMTVNYRIDYVQL